MKKNMKIPMKNILSIILCSYLCICSSFIAVRSEETDLVSETDQAEELLPEEETDLGASDQNYQTEENIQNVEAVSQTENEPETEQNISNESEAIAEEDSQIISASYDESEALDTANSYQDIPYDLSDTKEYFAGKKVSVLGDSMSAMQTDIPEDNSAYYNGDNHGITSASQMWYNVVCKNLGMELLVNESWSGSTVTGGIRSDERLPGSDPSRCERLAKNGVDPDIILIELGANDWKLINAKDPSLFGTWDGTTPLGESEDLSDYDNGTFRSAYGTMLSRIKRRYPNAQIYCLTVWFDLFGDSLVEDFRLPPSTISGYEFSQAIREIAGIIGCNVIDVSHFSFTKEEYFTKYSDGWAHGNAAGNIIFADTITNQLLSIQKEILENEQNTVINFEVTEQPQDVSVTAGETACFNVAANGEEVSYQWQYSTDDGINWCFFSTGTNPSAVTPELVLETALTYNGYLLRCVMCDKNGNELTSDSAKLEVKPIPVLEIVSQPCDTTAETGENVQFHVIAAGADVKYQWQYSMNDGISWTDFDIEKINSAISSDLSYNVETDQDGWLVRCILNDKYGAQLISDSAKISVICYLTLNANGGEFKHDYQSDPSVIRYQFDSTNRQCYLSTSDSQFNVIPDGRTFAGWAYTKANADKGIADIQANNSYVKIKQSDNEKNTVYYAVWAEPYTDTEAEKDIIIEGLKTNYRYTGSAIKPVIRVIDNGRILAEKTDYTVVYKNNTKAGKATVIVTAKSVKIEKTFNIDPVNMEEASAEAITLVQSEKPVKLTVKPKVTWNGNPLKAKTDYTIDCGKWNQTDIGEYDITLKGKGSFTGTKIIKVCVVKSSKEVVPVTKLKVTAKAVKYEDIRNAEDKFAEVLNRSGFIVSEGKTDLTKETAYTVEEDTITGCDRVGTCTFVISGDKKRYFGRRTVSIKINGTTISKAKPNKSAVYNGTERTLEDSGIDLNYGKTKLNIGTDYVILTDTYENNINVGKATVMVEGRGTYSGTAKITFTISPNTDTKIVEVKDTEYAKGGAMSEVIVKNGDTVLQEGTDYKLHWKNNKTFGSGNVTVTFQGKEM